MPVTPIEARCTRCGGRFLLAELLDHRTGSCPRCGRHLTNDWTSLLLDEARRADIAQQHLATSLRRLRELPSTFLLLPHPVLRNVAESLGWDHPSDSDGGLLDDQRKQLTDLARAWHPEAAPTSRRAWWRRRPATTSEAA